MFLQKVTSFLSVKNAGFSMLQLPALKLKRLFYTITEYLLFLLMNSLIR